MVDKGKTKSQLHNKQKKAKIKYYLVSIIKKKTKNFLKNSLLKTKPINFLFIV